MAARAESQCFACVQSFVSDFSTVTNFDGLNSGIYAFLTAAFVGAGFAYIGAPAQTLDAIFGTAFPKTPADLYLWQLIGGAVSTVVGPIALTQRVSIPVGTLFSHAWCFVAAWCAALWGAAVHTVNSWQYPRVLAVGPVASVATHIMTALCEEVIPCKC